MLHLIREQSVPSTLLPKPQAWVGTACSFLGAQRPGGSTGAPLPSPPPLPSGSPSAPPWGACPGPQAAPAAAPGEHTGSSSTLSSVLALGRPPPPLPSCLKGLLPAVSVTPSSRAQPAAPTGEGAPPAPAAPAGTASWGQPSPQCLALRQAGAVCSWSLPGGQRASGWGFSAQAPGSQAALPSVGGRREEVHLCPHPCHPGKGKWIHQVNRGAQDH